MTKVKRPNIVRGGIAVPLGRNYYYMRGRKHEQGGIDIGKNPRIGLEVEDGEVMHVGSKDIKVFSSLPFLNGKSPAQRVMSGENPNAVFNAQERFKKRNKINDDGTKKKRMGGLSRSKDYGSKSKPYPSVKSGDFAGGERSYPIPTKADARDALRLAGLHHRPDVKAKVYRKYPELRKKTKAGGLYSLTVNGETTLHQFPSTGEIKQSATANSAERSTMKYGGRKHMRAGGDETQAERARKYAEKIRNSIPNFAPAVRNYKFDDPANHPPFQLTKPNSRNNTKTNSRNNSKPTTNVMVPEITVTGRRRNITNNKRTTSNSRRDNILTNIQFRPDDRIGDFEAVDKSPVNRQNNSRIVSINRITPVSIANIESPSLTSSIPNRQYQANDRLNTLRKITPAPITGSIPVPTLNVTVPNVSADINASTTIGTRSNSKFRDFLTNNVDNIADGLGLLTNIGLSIAGRNINNRMLNSLRYTNAPIPQRAAKLKTRININPQLDRMRESLASYERNIDANTGSSKIALARKQRARLADILGRNELYGDKENKETELINTDKINQQEVANKNIEAYNNWAAGKAAFENSIAEQKANNRIAAINNINAGVQQIVSNIQQRMADQRTLAALTLGSPNLPAEMFYGSDIWNKRMYDSYRRSYPFKRK